MAMLWLENFCDVFFDRFGRVGGRIAFDDFAGFVDQEFGEVPFDGFGAENSRRAFFQNLIERCGVRSVDFDFGEQRKADVVFQGTEALDLASLPGS